MLKLSHNEALESFDAQKLAVIAILIGSAMSLVVIYGAQEQESGKYPCKDYSYLAELPKASAFIFVITTAYFVYLSYLQYQEDPGNHSVLLLLWVSVLAAVAALLREYVVITRQGNNIDVTVEEAALDF